MNWVDRIGRRVKLRDVHILLTVADAGGVGRAARRLAISQPVVSKAIGDLERSFGVALFDRSRREIELTPYGRVILESGIAAFDELRRGVQRVEFLTCPNAGEVRIGTTEPMTAGLLPPLIDGICASHPRVSIDVIQGPTTASLYRELRDREVDFVLGRLPPAIDKDLSTETLFNEPLTVVAGTKNKLASRRRLELARLMDEWWVMPRVETPAIALIMELFRRCGVQPPKNVVVCNSVQLQISMLATSSFLALLPRSLLHFSGARLGLRALPVKLPVLDGPVGIVQIKNRTPKPVSEFVIGRLREMSKRLEGGR